MLPPCLASISQIEVMRHSPGGPSQEHLVKLSRRRTRLTVAILFGESDRDIRDLTRITPENWGGEEAPGDGDVQLNQFLPEGMALPGLTPAFPTSQCCALTPLTDTLNPSSYV